jgi:hypothetical protein
MLLARTWLTRIPALARSHCMDPAKSVYIIYWFTWYRLNQYFNTVTVFHYSIDISYILLNDFCILVYIIGIGRAIAIRLANLGAKVFGISRTQADLDSLKKEVFHRSMR